MILTIEPLHEDSRHCMEDILASLGCWWKRDSIMMFARSWGFVYKSKDGEKFGSRIDSGWTDEDLILFEKYHGIYTSKQIPKHKEETLEVISRELSKGYPALLYIDSYYCSWAPTYYKFNNLHTCLIVGSDKKKNGLYCIDPYVSNKVEFIRMEDYSKGCKGYMTFDLREKYRGKIDWKDIISYSMSGIDGTKASPNAFQLMRSFATDVDKSLDMTWEMEGYEVQDMKFVPLFIRLIHISNGRMNYAKLLRYLSKECKIEELSLKAFELEKAGEEWRQIVGLLAKVGFMPRLINKIRSMAVDSIHVISEQEERIYKDLVSLVS